MNKENIIYLLIGLIIGSIITFIFITIGISDIINHIPVTNITINVNETKLIDLINQTLINNK